MELKPGLRSLIIAAIAVTLVVTSCSSRVTGPSSGDLMAIWRWHRRIFLKNGATTQMLFGLLLWTG